MDYREWRFMDEGLALERRKEQRDEALADEPEVRERRQKTRRMSKEKDRYEGDEDESRENESVLDDLEDWLNIHPAIVDKIVGNSSKDGQKSK